jgi:hypothetical protein
MDKIFANIIILPMLGYHYSKVNFHCSKLFHLIIFMTIYGYV